MLSLFDIKRAVQPVRKSEIRDDFRILDSWTEYDDDSSVATSQQRLQYLCYLFETVDPHSGEVHRLYKAIRFCRVKRMPASMKQSTTLMDMQEKIMASVWENGYNLITVIANVIKPKPIGLLYLYGLQGVSANLDEAKRIASASYIGFTHAMQAKFRVLHMQTVIMEEAEWLRDKLYHMDHMAVVRGIPWAEKAGEDAGNKGMGNRNINPDSQGTLEDLIAGMVSYEYVLEVLFVPLSTDTLLGWQREIQRQVTDWYPSLQGQDSVGFNISLPMMYGANVGQAQGWSKGYTSNATESFSQGQSYNFTDGQSVGRSLTQSFGQSYTENVGRNISTSHTVGTNRNQSFGQSENYGESVGTSFSQSFGQSHTISKSVGTSVTQGHTVGSSNGWSQGYGQNVGTSQNVGFNQGTSQNVGFNQGQNIGHSQNIGKTTNIGQNFGISETQNQSINTGTSRTASVNQGQSATTSHGVSNGNSYTFARGQNTGLGHTLGTGQNVNFNQGTNANYGASANSGQSASRGLTNGMTETFGDGTSANYNNGLSAGMSRTHNNSASWNDGNSQNLSRNDSVTASAGGGTGLTKTIGGNAIVVNGSGSGTENDNASLGVNNGTAMGDGHNGGISYTVGDGVTQNLNETIGRGYGANFNHSVGGNAGSSATYTQNTSLGNTMGWGQNATLGQGFSSNESFNTTQGRSLTESFGANAGTSDSVSTGQTIGFSSSLGQTQGMSMSSGRSSNMGMSFGESTNVGTGMSVGVSNGMSVGQGTTQGSSVGYGATQGASANWGLNGSQSVSDSLSVGQNWSQSESLGTNESVSYGQNYGQNHSVGYNVSESVGQSESLGTTTGQSVGKSVGETTSTGYGQNIGESRSVSTGSNTSTSRGTSTGLSNAMNGSTSMGTSASFGLSAGISYSHSNQWLNQGVKDYLEVLEFANNRIKKAIRGAGMFQTYVYLGCPSADALSAAQAIAKSTWQNEWAVAQPLQVLDLSETAQRHLLPRMYGFSADVSEEDVHGEYRQRYGTALGPEEAVAYAHLPRISEGGITTIALDIPKFTVPSDMPGEIFMGTVINPERYDLDNGYMTPYRFRIDESMLMHGYFTGGSRSGKTVAAMRFIAELSRIRRKKTGKRLRIVVLDPKQDWRALARFVEPKRFRFGSLGNPDFEPIKLNVWKIPHGVRPQSWIDGVIDIYCRAYGLLERGKQMIADVVYRLYKRAGVMDIPTDQAGWEEKVADASAKVCFADIYKEFEKDRNELFKRGQKAGNQTIEGYDRLIERLSCFGRDFSVECKLYGTSQGLGIDDLIGDDDVTVLESLGLETTFKNFLFGTITAGFYKYAKSHDGGFLAPNQYETVMVIEEANEVLIGTDTGKKNSDVSLPGQSVFEEMLDQSAGYGLFVIAITQKISQMPTSVVANCGILFAGRLKHPDDINIVVRSIGREERMDDRDTVKFFPVCPTGWFVCQTSRARDWLDAQPVLVSVSMLNVSRPTNDELEEILTFGRAQSYMGDAFSTMASAS